VGISGLAAREYSAAEAASILKAAVGMKASNRKIPTRDRADIVLALDATRLPGIAFDAVVEQFRNSHGAWATQQGFAAVWLVEPMPRLVWRLDTGNEHGAV
jgi:hypothetical protein